MLTADDIRRNSEFHEANSTRQDGTCYRWRKNGALKLWKTRPDDFRQPVKYGLRSYDAITPANADHWVPADRCPNCAKLAAKLAEKANAR